MNIPALVAMGVALADSQTKSTQMTVQHYPVIGTNEFGPIHGGPNPVQAVVIDGQRAIVKPDGTQTSTTADLIIPRPLVVTSDDLFKVTAPGFKDEQVPVLKKEAVLDDHGRPYMVEVWLGR